MTMMRSSFPAAYSNLQLTEGVKQKKKTAPKKKKAATTSKKSVSKKNNDKTIRY
jgi:ribosomal protein L24